MTRRAWPALALPAAPVVACLVVACPAAAEDPWVGTWAAEAEWCENDDTSEEGPVHIEPEGYYGFEAQCRYEVVRRTGAASWRIDADCTAGGRPYRETLLYALDGDLLRVTYLDRDGENVTFRRCR